MPKAKRNSKPSPRSQSAKRRRAAKPRTQPHANDDEETLWQPLPGYPHSEFLDVANYRLIRKREFPENGLHLVGHEDDLWLSSSRSYADKLPETPSMKRQTKLANSRRNDARPKFIVTDLTLTSGC